MYFMQDHVVDEAKPLRDNVPDFAHIMATSAMQRVACGKWAG